MQAVFEVGIAAEQDPQVHKNSLVREFEESLQWWLHTRPEVCNCSYVCPDPPSLLKPLWKQPPAAAAVRSLVRV